MGEFLIDALKQGLRVDGRTHLESREISISFPHELGNAEVHYSNTLSALFHNVGSRGVLRVLWQLYLQKLQNPIPIGRQKVFSYLIQCFHQWLRRLSNLIGRPCFFVKIHSFFSFSVFFSMSDRAIEISKVVERGIRDSRAINVESLCIVAGEKVVLL